MQELKLGQHFGSSKGKLQLRDLTISEAVIDAEVNVPWHYHENAYFLYNMRGSFLEINKKDQIACTPSTLLYHNWEEAHCNKNISESADYFHIEIEKSWFDKHGLHPDIIQGSRNIHQPEIKGIFQRIYSELNVQDSVTALSIDGLLTQAFSMILRQGKSVPLDLQPKWISLLKELMMVCSPEELDLNRLAAEIGVSPVHLSRSFPRYFDKSFGSYIRGIKVERAKELLTSGKLSNVQIAQDCGFSDESHFIKVFKSHFGITPGKYKEQISVKKIII